MIICCRIYQINYILYIYRENPNARVNVQCVCKNFATRPIFQIQLSIYRDKHTHTHADSTYKLKVSVRVLELCRNHLSINKIASAFSMDKIKLYCDSNCKLI